MPYTPADLEAAQVSPVSTDPKTDTADLLRRIQLSIDGFARYETVSTWVNNELLKESKAEIARLTRELSETRKSFCPHGIRNGPENCIACEDPTKLGFTDCDVAGGCRELRFMRAQRDAALRARDALHAALDRILKIGPLGVDTYPECYRRMRAIAVEALNGEPS